MKIIETHTSMYTYRTCPAQYRYRYMLGIVREATDKALRFGSIMHLAIEAHRKRLAFDIAPLYEHKPDHVAQFDWDEERETAVALFDGYKQRYQNELDYVAVEPEFKMVLPRVATIRGKIDAIARYDGGLALVETKTYDGDISDDSDYWLRLRIDPQISLYYLAANTCGYDVSTVIYDVIRKPTIGRYKATPEDKRKYTKSGELYANQRHADETPEDWGRRLADDIATRPDYYYQRREIPRLETDIQQFHAEVLQQIKQMKTAMKHGWWFRNPSRVNCGRCQYSDICLQGIDVTQQLPTGYTVAEKSHPELT